MSHQRMLLSSAALAAALVFGCSHKQPPPASMANDDYEPSGEPKQAAKAPAAPSDAVADATGDEIYFDFDSANLREDARPVLQKVAASLKSDANKQVRVEGHCDDLGTPEYNVALGEQRARAAKDYLTRLGVADTRIQVVSFGAERPKYTGQNADARAKNRRDDLVLR